MKALQTGIARALFTVTLLILIAGCVSAPVEYIKYKEVLEVPIKRTEASWHRSYDRKHLGESLTKFLPDGQDEESWEEKLIIRFISDKISYVKVSSHIDDLISRTHTMCPKSDLLIYDEDEKEAFYELSIKNCKKHDDSVELGRFVKGTSGMHSVMYITRNIDITDEKKELWLDRMRRATIKNMDI